MNNWPEIIKVGIAFLLMPIWLPLSLFFHSAKAQEAKQ